MFVPLLVGLCLCFLGKAQDSRQPDTPASSEPQNLVTIVDLTHESHEDSVKPPLVRLGLRRNVSFVDVDDGENSRFKVEDICFLTHYGTHVDAPCHYKGSWCVTDLPLERLVLVPASVIDIRAKIFRNDTTEADSQLTIDDIQDWEETYGQIPGQSVIMALTGWSTFWNTPGRYLGGGGRDNLHYPGISPKAAEWIVRNRPTVYGMGIDTVSADYGRSRKFPTHSVLTKANMYILENVANLERLPPTGALVNIGVLKLGREASGAPARITATYSSRSQAPTPSRRSSSAPAE